MASVPGLSGDVTQADQAAKANNALWYTFTGIGRAYLVRRGTAAASDADVSSAHGYATIEQAYANPNSKGAATQATITQWNLYSSLPVGGGEAGVVETVDITAPTSPGGSASVSTQQNPTTASAGSLLNWPTFKNLRDLVVRTVKVLAGLALVVIGVSKMTGTDKKVIGAAKTYAKAAVLA